MMCYDQVKQKMVVKSINSVSCNAMRLKCIRMQQLRDTLNAIRIGNRNRIDYRARERARTREEDIIIKYGFVWFLYGATANKSVISVFYWVCAQLRKLCLFINLVVSVVVVFLIFFSLFWCICNMKPLLYLRYVAAYIIQSANRYKAKDEKNNNMIGIYRTEVNKMRSIFTW